MKILSQNSTESVKSNLTFLYSFDIKMLVFCFFTGGVSGIKSGFLPNSPRVQTFPLYPSSGFSPYNCVKGLNYYIKHGRHIKLDLCDHQVLLTLNSFRFLSLQHVVFTHWIFIWGLVFTLRCCLPVLECYQTIIDR